LILKIGNNGLRIIFSHTIEFDEVALKISEDHYNKVRITETQKKLINGICKVLCEFINIPDLAMKGTAYKALSKWQVVNNSTILKISDMPIGRGLNAVKEIFRIYKNLLKEMLTDPQNKNKTIIDIAFEKAFKMILDHISRIQN